MAAEPSKTFSQPHSSATLHFTQLKQLIITPAPSKVPPNFSEPDSPTFQKNPRLELYEARLKPSLKHPLEPAARQLSGLQRPTPEPKG